jgi:hypothetical protein
LDITTVSDCAADRTMDTMSVLMIEGISPTETAWRAIVKLK